MSPARTGAIAALLVLLSGAGVAPCIAAGEASALAQGKRLYFENASKALPSLLEAAKAADGKLRAEALLYASFCHWSLLAVDDSKQCLTEAFLADPSLEVPESLTNEAFRQGVDAAREAARKAREAAALLEKGYRLSIESDPPGAAIFIRGRKLRKPTPMAIRIKAGGVYEVTLKKGSLTWSGSVNLDRLGETYEIKARLLSSTGVLVVESDPPGASITLEGKSRGKTPARFSLAPGTYDIRLGAPGHRTVSTRAVVKARLTERLRPRLAPLCPQGMAYVPAGSFIAGSKRGFTDEPYRRPSLPAFCIDLYEYPNARGQMPLAAKTWMEAAQICASHGKRLCSGDEWERAARGTEGRTYPFGNAWNADACNTADRFGAKRQPARCGSFPKCVSPVGAYDMAGNVWEWVGDAYTRYDPKASPELRVVRGGSCFKGAEDCRSANVNFVPRTTRNAIIGFRCCSDAK